MTCLQTIVQIVLWLIDRMFPTSANKARTLVPNFPKDPDTDRPDLNVLVLKFSFGVIAIVCATVIAIVYVTKG